MRDLNRAVWYTLTSDKQVVPVSTSDLGPEKYIAILKALDNQDLNRVGRTQIGPFLVSTVFLCCNVGFPGRSLFFETMVFHNDHRENLDSFTRRYETYEEALDGHKKIVEHVQTLHAVAQQIAELENENQA